MEVKVYGVHIRQGNNIKSVISEEFIKLIESYEAVLVLDTKDPVRNLASFILPSRTDQEAFMKALSKRGIKMCADKFPGYADKALLERFGGKWQVIK